METWERTGNQPVPEECPLQHTPEEPPGSSPPVPPQANDTHTALAVSIPYRLQWRVHLLRSQPQRLPGILIVFAIGTVCVWMMFATLIPVLAALLLLAGSISDYLFPITYHLTDTEVGQESITSQIHLPWDAIRRCVQKRHALLLTTLPAPSRLDAFRGILIRFAPDGQPGDRQSVLTTISTFAPHLLLPKTEDGAETTDNDTTTREQA